MPDAVKPNGPTLTRLGQASGYFCFAWLVALPALLAASGVVTRGLTLAAVVVVWYGPLVLWVIFRLSWRWTGRPPVYSALLLWPQPSAVVDEIGLALFLPESGEMRLPWSAIGSLLAIPGNERLRFGPMAIKLDTGRPSELRAPDDTVIALVPNQLVLSAGSTMASRVLLVQPDRYVATGTAYRGWPGGFALRTQRTDQATSDTMATPHP